MQNASQTEIKIAGTNINNLRYADDTTLTAKSEEEQKSLLMRVKEESEKAGLKHNIQKLRSWHLVPSLHAKKKRKKVKQTGFLFLGSKIPVDSDCSHEIKRPLLLGWKAMTNPQQDVKKQSHHFANQGPYNKSYGFSSSHVCM